MSALFSLIVQIASIVAGIYIGFKNSAWAGIALPVVVWTLHVAFSKLSSGLMLFHQKKLMNPFERAMLEADFGLLGNRAKAPEAWGKIATVVGWAYVVVSAAIVAYALKTYS